MERPVQLTRDPGLAAFVKRVLVCLLLLTLLFVAWRLTELLLLLFGAALLAIALRAATRPVAWLSRLGYGASLAVVVSAAAILLGLALWSFGSVIADQIDEMVRQVPAGPVVVDKWLEAHPYGRRVLEQIRAAGATGVTGWIATALAAVTRTTTRALGYSVLVVVASIYLAAQPDRYRVMLMRFVPPGQRSMIDRAIGRAVPALRRWLIGQLVVMLVIGVLSGFGLWALGIEAAFTLGLIGGLLCFIPYVGAVIAAVPATLIALSQGPGYALSVVAMYVGVHVVEGNFITPLVQAEATAVPPVLFLIAAVGLSTMLGPSAVLLAAPLLVFALVLAEVIYVEEMLGQPADLLDAPAGSSMDEGAD